MDKQALTVRVKELAYNNGFDFVGISKAEFLQDEVQPLENWLKKGMNGKMGYMENYFDKRLDPTKLVPGAKSVISFAMNYYPEKGQKKKNAPKLSKYAYGMDYHFVIKDRLKSYLDQLRQEIGEINGRVFVDSAPILEKAWAKNSGLGWIGKNSNLITTQMGSFLFLAELISDLDLVPDGPISDYCGTCTKCIDACPTDAIHEPYSVDGSKCISYFTIELKDSIIPNEYEDKFNDWVFGCDICQDVCPWNRFSKPNDVPELKPDKKILEMDRTEWMEITQEVFNEIFKKSAVKRTKFLGLKRNLRFISHK